MNRIQKEILKRLEKIVRSEDRRLPKDEEAYITDCRSCGAILVSTKLVMGEVLVYLGKNELAHNTVGYMMCINCEFVHKQRIMINDEKIRQHEKKAST